MVVVLWIGRAIVEEGATEERRIIGTLGKIIEACRVVCADEADGCAEIVRLQRGRNV